MKESDAYQWIIDEGILVGWRQSVIDVVEHRFGKREANALKGLLGSLDDPKRLRQLHRLAIRCKKADDVRKAIAS